MGGLPPKPPIGGRLTSPKPPAKGSYPDGRKLLKADLSWLIKLFLWQMGKSQLL